MLGKITDKKEVVKGTLQVTFEIKEGFNFKPGQYVFLTLNLRHPDERGGRRHFSINNSPNEKGVIVITTRLSESGFKKTLMELPVGSEVELGPIAGAFTLPEDFQKSLVFIAGGIGITPFMSMLKFVLEENLPYNITLVYSNRDQVSTAFLNEIQNFKFRSVAKAMERRRQISNFKLILTMTEDPDWQGEKRRVDENFIKEYFPSVNNNYYMVVGPPAMTEAVQKSLVEAGVSEENIKIEKFTGY